MVAVAKVHPMPVAAGELTVHDIEPDGLYPVDPETRAVSVVVPPRVGEADALSVTVGMWKAIPIVTVLERTLV